MSLAWIEEERPLVVDGKKERDRSVIREFVYNFRTHLKKIHCWMCRTPIIMWIIIWINWTRSKIQKIIWYLFGTAETLNVKFIFGKSWKTHPEIFLKFSFSGSSHRPFYWKTHPFDFLAETIYHIDIICGFSQKIRMDEFSSQTACVTSRKMKISEKFLDEFSMICQ